jgi:hypothetical protein
MAAVSHFQMLIAINDKVTPVEEMETQDPAANLFDPYGGMHQKKMAAMGIHSEDAMQYPVKPVILTPGPAHMHDYTTRDGRPTTANMIATVS